MKTIEKAATKSRVKAKHADSPTTNSVHNELSEGHRAKLGELFKVIGGGTPTTQVSDYWIGNIPWISSADIDDDHRVSARKCISPAALKASTTNLVPANSVIVVTRVGLGKVAIAPTDMCFSQDCQALLFGEKEANPRFVLHQLGLATQIFRYISRGTTIPGVTKKQLLDLEFWLPPLPTQHRIVAEIEEKLSRLDAAQSALLRAQANLKRYRESVLEASFDIVRDQNLREAGDLLSYVTSGSRGWAKYYASSGAAFIRVGNVRRNQIALDLEDLQCVQLPSGAEGKRTRLEIDDILITVTADVGRIGVVEKGIGEAYVNQHVALARPNALCTARFLAWFLTSKTGNRQLTMQQRGATRTGLGLGDISNVLVPVPKLETQLEIVTEIERRLSVIDRTEQTLRTQLERAKRLRQSILQQAFSLPK